MEMCINDKFEEWKNNAINILNTYFIKLNNHIQVYAPKKSDEEFHSLYVEALRKKDYVEYILDILTFGNLEDKIQVYKTYRKEVTLIAEQNRKSPTT